jgi:hypothetical protein
MNKAWMALALTGFTLQTQALGRLAEVQIIDRDSGTALATHYHRGEYWVAGAPGARYAIAIRNARGERLLAVTAVDGVNVISGDTAAWDQSGYVFGPGQGYEIAGWRKSNAEVAAFEFTAAPSSYAARTGRPGNIGVIGVALFRERPRPIRYEAPQDALSATADEASAPPSAAAGAPADRARAERVPAPEARLGTGHGARESSLVEDTEFERLHDRPDEIIRIRYDSYANLLAAGIIHARPPLLPRPDAFPGSTGFAPDPPPG